MSSTTIGPAFAKAYGWFASICSSAQSPLSASCAPLLGWQFMQTGWGKLHNLAQVAQFFAGLGIPAPGPTALFVAAWSSSAVCC